MPAESSLQKADRLARLMAWQVTYQRVLAGVLIVIGLYHWAAVIGLSQLEGAGFADLGAARQWATINLAVAYPAAAVGLWMLASWGMVIWVYAAVTEIATHTIFAATFGVVLGPVVLQLVLFAIYGGFRLMLQRAQLSDTKAQGAQKSIAPADRPVGSGRFTVAARNRIAASIGRRRGVATDAGGGPADAP